MMKKLLLLFLIAFIAASCGDEYYTEDVNGFTLDYTVYKQDWKSYSGPDGDYFYCFFDEPMINDVVYNKGIIVGYLIRNIEGEGEVISQLPFTDFYGNYEDQYSCDFARGGVTFIVKHDDLANTQPPTLVFRVKAMY